MDSDTGGPSLMESLCHFANKENEDSTVVNILRLQQVTKKERVRTHFAVCLSVILPHTPTLLPPHALPPPLSWGEQDSHQWDSIPQSQQLACNEVSIDKG